MKFSLLLCVAAILIFSQCNDVSAPHPDYPTVYRKLPLATLDSLKVEYAQSNPYLRNSLDEYGFSGYSSENVESTPPPQTDFPTDTEAFSLAVDFLLKNSKYTGVPNSESLESLEVRTMHTDPPSRTYFRFYPQKIDTISVQLTGIILHLQYDEVVYCSGNWYPEIYIPEEFEVSAEEAINSLEGRTVTHYTFAGQPYHILIEKDSLEGIEAGLAIVPKESNHELRLHVTWLIELPFPVAYRFYIDVMTGEIIQSSPTIVS